MTLLQRLNTLLGDGGVVDSPADMAAWLEDERGLYQGRAACVVLPKSVAEVAAVVRLCNELDYAVVPQGGNTGYCGGATPMGERQVLVKLSRLDGIRAIDPLGMTATVEAGIVLANLQAAVADRGLFFPLSMGSQGSCQLGGNLATNAGGLAVLKYGTAGELVLGLEVVLPSGEVLDLLKPLRKDNTGYHLERLFLGAEGSLGIITAATLKLFPAPTERQTAWLALPGLQQACELLPLARRLSGDTVTTFEYISGQAADLLQHHLSDARPVFPGKPGHQVLLELSAPMAPGALRAALEGLLEESVARGLVQDAVLAETGTQRNRLWALREGIPEAEKLAGRSIKHDVSVAISDIPDYVAKALQRLHELAPLRSSIYGHLGDGNLHFNVLAPEGEDPAAFRQQHGGAISRLLHDLAAHYGGSFSAEHGVGQLKRPELERYTDPVALALMRALKGALDPHNRMNPGKLVEPPEA